MNASRTIIVCIITLLPFAMPASAQTPMAAAAEPRRNVGIDEDLLHLILIRSAGDQAVVRFGTKPPQVISVGDRLGRARAEVKEIGAHRLVLEEIFRAPDGQANRAVIILKDGERGGKRYVARSTEQAPPAVRPTVAVPAPKKER
jgi:hypothetical protein